MNPDGYLGIVLHAHLPFVRHPEHPEFLEENWLFEALTESYLPILSVLDRLLVDAVDFRITVGLTPTLITMLEDDLLRKRYRVYLDRLIDLAGRESRRLFHHPALGPTARFYRQRFRALSENYLHRLEGDMVGAFRRLQELRRVEILASAATHAFLPNLRPAPAAIRAQIRVGVEQYRRAFGCDPQGFWLPECAYFPGLDELLRDEGIRFFVVESHGILRGDRQTRHGVYAPVVCPSGVAAFGRDPETSRLVWSSKVGYPGDAQYRDFYRDIGFDAPPDTLGDALGPDGVRVPTGLKYHRVTGRTAHKQPYDRRRAMERVEAHARDFVSRVSERLRARAAVMDRRPLILAPYDAELFGHWWFEGPEWLDRTLRLVSASGSNVASATLSEYLAENPTAELCVPSESSWGEGGYHEIWLNDANDDCFRRTRDAARKMTALARNHPRARGSLRRALDQASREVLLSQSSDWLFLQRSGTAPDYARRRLEEHLRGFERIAGLIENGKFAAGSAGNAAVFSEELDRIEARDAIFPWLDYTVFSWEESERGGDEVRHVAFLSPEAAPYAKAGGLGDVGGSLPLALAGIGVRVSLVLPAYRAIDRERFGVRVLREGLGVWAGGREKRFHLLEAESPAPGVRVLLIDHPGFFHRNGIYDDPRTGKEYADSAERYLFYCRAALESLSVLGEPIDILHCHDHQTAMALAMHRMDYRRDPVFTSSAGIFTIHNLGYQGIHGPEVLEFAGIDREWFYPGSPFEFHGKVNLLKIGIELADKVNAVSERYAREIRESREQGGLLQGVLQRRGADLVGILNGMDTSIWNPATDPLIPAPYSAEDPGGKRAAKKALLEALGLDPDHLDRVPLVGMVSRLVDQKGLDLLEEGLDEIMGLGVDLAILGSGLPKYHTMLREASRLYRGRMGVALRFDNTLAHLIEAGSDLFLMPSLYEPCGLNQMYSLRYGTVPVVRSTGGLADTVSDDDTTPGGGLGFTFEAYTAGAMIDALERALRAYRDPARWKRIMVRGMRRDFSWKVSATRYLDLYRQAHARRARRRLSPRPGAR